MVVFFPKLVSIQYFILDSKTLHFGWGKAKRSPDGLNPWFRLISLQEPQGWRAPCWWCSLFSEHPSELQYRGCSQPSRQSWRPESWSCRPGVQSSSTRCNSRTFCCTSRRLCRWDAKRPRASSTPQWPLWPCPSRLARPGQNLPWNATACCCTPQCEVQLLWPKSHVQAAKPFSRVFSMFWMWSVFLWKSACTSWWRNLSAWCKFFAPCLEFRWFVFFCFLQSWLPGLISARQGKG